jgi:hypothetical protein
MYAFALNSTTMAVEYEPNGKGLAVLIPKGAEIATEYLPQEPPVREPSRLIEVRWNGKIVSIFALDLLERGERVDLVRSAADAA